MAYERSRSTGNPRARSGQRRRRRGRPSFPFNLEEINYKNVELLGRYISDRGKIGPRRKTGATGKMQRRLAREIKRARHLALLPYTAEQIRERR